MINACYVPENRTVVVNKLANIFNGRAPCLSPEGRRGVLRDDPSNGCEGVGLKKKTTFP